MTTNYRGFYYTAYAVWLCTQEPETLHYITKWLYPAVAKRYGTNWQSVERNIRTVVGVAWRRNPELMCSMAGCALSGRPASGKFLSMVANWVQKPVTAPPVCCGTLAVKQN